MGKCESIDSSPNPALIDLRAEEVDQPPRYELEMRPFEGENDGVGRALEMDENVPAVVPADQLDVGEALLWEDADDEFLRVEEGEEDRNRVVGVKLAYGSAKRPVQEVGVKEDGEGIEVEGVVDRLESREMESGLRREGGCVRELDLEGVNVLKAE